MAVVRVSMSSVIQVPPALVYGILADYRDGHPHILPRRYFTDLVVERGGMGEGTCIRFGMKGFGVRREAVAEITEPLPGRVLAETILATGAVTTFTVEPRDGGLAARVTIATQWSARGVGGMIERLLAPSFLKRVYAAELKQLAIVASAQLESAVAAVS